MIESQWIGVLLFACPGEQNLDKVCERVRDIIVEIQSQEEFPKNSKACLRHETITIQRQLLPNIVHNFFSETTRGKRSSRHTINLLTQQIHPGGASLIIGGIDERLKFRDFFTSLIYLKFDFLQVTDLLILLESFKGFDQPEENKDHHLMNLLTAPGCSYSRMGGHSSTREKDTQDTNFSWNSFINESTCQIHNH